MKNSILVNLKNILHSYIFQVELKEMSSYCAHIKQERPIMYLIAKHLKRKGFITALEMKKDDKKWDLVVNDTSIEAKFYYEKDILLRLKKELERTSWNIDEARRIGKTEKHGWKMLYPILKDLDKNPDIFILMIVSRDLRRVPKNNQDKICVYEDEKKYYQDYGFNNKETFKQLDKFFKLIKKEYNKNFICQF